MRVVFDSNVIIAAFASRGLCNALLETSIGNHEIILCEEILQEVSLKLNQKIYLPDKIIKQIVSFLRAYSSCVIPQRVDRSVCRDARDLMVLGSAIAGKAKYIITGDKDLLTIGKFKDITIIDPRVFWNKLKKEKS